MSLNKKLLSGYMKEMLKNTQRGLLDLNEHYAVKMFGGNDTTLTISTPGKQPLTFTAPEGDIAKPTLTIVDEGCTALERFVEECGKDECIGMYVGRSAIEKEIETVLRQWLDKAVVEEELASDIRDALKRIRNEVQPWTVYFSIQNLVLKDVDKFVIGNVRLLPIAAYRSTLKADIFSSIDKSATDSKSKQDIKLKLDDQISEFYPADGTLAVLTVNAEQSRIRDVADHALGEVFGVLRGFTHKLFSRNRRCLFGLKGWLIRSPEMWLGTAETNDEWTFGRSRVGALSTYEISTEVIDHLREHCALDTLHDILCRTASERSQLEQAIAVAAQWHGAAVNVLTAAEGFVWHTVAIERLLICDNEQSATDQFCNRLAWLLGSTGEQRQYLYKLASRLYDTRSRIVHAGQTHVEQDQLSYIDALASDLLIAVAKRSSEWTTQEDMRNWVKAQLMGA